MKVKVLAFARYSELLGFKEAEYPLPEPPILGELLKHPSFTQLPQEAMLSVNKKFAGRDGPIFPGDEVALMPPVSGG